MRAIGYLFLPGGSNLIAYLTAPPWGPHREAPVSPQGGGPWGYRLTHIYSVLITTNAAMQAQPDVAGRR